ncbi:MAG: hypothetical protein LPD71_00080 [Shewanella sp.]|nr:hypothetical protein [Shewanella sp.]MCF1437199.1 hypothetical protein [Shewanella sp.]MCF1459487.1 hypothetical protein [Shewanella sp.]
MPTEKFSVYLSQISSGMLDAELSDVLTTAIRDIKSVGGKFDLSLKLKIYGGEDKGDFMVKIDPTYTVKHTPVELGGSIYRCLPDDTLDLFIGNRGQGSIKAV